MAIPDYQTVMLPLLKLMADGKERPLREIVRAMEAHFQLTDEEKADLLPSGKIRTIQNRTGWAKTYLKKAGLLKLPKRGVVAITNRGQEVLESKPSYIDVKFLEQFPEFVEFTNLRHDREGSKEHDQPSSTTPEEDLEKAHQALHEELSDEILSTIKGCSPEFFETLVVDLLVSMGYGGSRKEAGSATKMSGDGGIDGIIKEDKLGLDTIYIQAKRWESNVSRPEIQKFAGALQGVRAKKGVFITTSGFTSEARGYATQIESKIILIDGPMLTDLMIDHGVGVTEEAVYRVMRMDSDYFEEE